MRKLIAFVLGAFLLVPSLGFAQTLTETQKQTELSALYQELAQLEQEIQIILDQQELQQTLQTQQTIQIPEPSAASLEEEQQTQYTQNCINTGVANNESAGLDRGQAYAKATIDCPN